MEQSFDTGFSKKILDVESRKRFEPSRHPFRVSSRGSVRFTPHAYLLSAIAMFEKILVIFISYYTFYIMK